MSEGVAQNELDGLPTDLVSELERRDARVVALRREAARVYAEARSASERLFVRVIRGPRADAHIRHEAEARRLIGAVGDLRTPPVVALGSTWLVEPFVESKPIAGTAVIEGAVQAVNELARTSVEPLPPGPRDKHAIARRVAYVARVARSPLRGEMIPARRTMRQVSLPTVTTHGDFHAGNLLNEGEGLWVVDWEMIGRRPVGFDLMTLWPSLERADDREHLFSEAARVVGPGRLADLRRLRYGLLVHTIASKWCAPNDFDRDPSGAAALYELLPRVRAEATSS